MDALNEGRWLLLIRQLPPQPNNLRVKIWRRLQRLGAGAIKTLENLSDRLGLNDPALRPIAEIVHDIMDRDQQQKETTDGTSEYS